MSLLSDIQRKSWPATPPLVMPSAPTLVTPPGRPWRYENLVDEFIPWTAADENLHRGEISACGRYEFFDAIGGVGEVYYACFARELHSRGWTCYPQEATGKRMPRKYQGEVIKWKRYQTERVDDYLQARWCDANPGANVAVIMGPTSGNVLAFDIDVTDEDLSLLTEELLEEICGPTPFKRIGNPPKIALFYRLARECSFTTKVIRYAEPDDETTVSSHIVEILGKHATITFYGVHHSTGRMFGWVDQPAFFTPESFPVITEEQIEEFIERMAELRPIYKPARSSLTMTPDATFGELGPGEYRDVTVAAKPGEWSTSAAGLVNDGRHKFLLRYTYQVAVANLPQIPALEQVERLIPRAAADFMTKIERSGDWAIDGKVTGRVAGHIRRMAEKMATPETRDFTPPKSRLHVRSQRAGALPAITAPAVEGARWPLTAAPAEDRPGGNMKFEFDRSKSAETIAADRHARRLLTQEERAPIRAKATADNELATQLAYKIVDEVAADPEANFDTIAALGGAGSGKTVTFLRGAQTRYQSRAKRNVEVKIDGKSIQMRQKTVALFANHSMMEEKAEFLQREFGDKVRLIAKDALEATPDEPGVVQVMIHRGIDKSLCHLQDLRQAIIADDFSPSGLCSREIEVMVDGELKKQVQRCVFWSMGKCAAKAQPIAGRNAQLVFAAHAYETSAAMPTFLSRATELLAIDEDATMGFVNVETLSFENLLIERPCSPTKALYQAGVKDELAMAGLRATGTELVMAALHGGTWNFTAKRPAIDADYRLDETGQRVVRDGLHVVTSRLNVGQQLALMDAEHEKAKSSRQTKIPPSGSQVLAACRRSVAKDDPRGLEVAPLTSVDSKASHAEDITKLVSKRQPRHAGVKAERMLWQIVQEQYERACIHLEGDRMAWKHLRLRQDLARAVLADRSSTTHDRWDAEETLRLRQPPNLYFIDDADARFQRVLRAPREGALKSWHVRISKRLEPNLPNVPLLLLDASGSVDRMKTIWQRKVTTVGKRDTVPHHLRTIVDCSRSYSPSSLLPHKDDTTEAKKNKLQDLADIRLLITIAAHEERNSRIAVVTTRGLRRYINSKEWAAPENVSWLHFGALRGRDFAKKYAGIIVIGRSQMQIGDIDGISAGLAYDSKIKFAPFDVRGDGLTEDEKPLFRGRDIARVQMRDGNDLLITQAHMPAGVGRNVERSWREEEIYQAICRLRTAHREGDAPWAILLGNLVPEGVVVDVMTTLKDLIRVPNAKVAEAARIAGKLVNPPAFGDANLDYSLDDDDLRDYQTRAAVERRAIEIRASGAKVTPGAAMARAWSEHDNADRPGLYREAGLSETIVSAAHDEAALAALGVDAAKLDVWARETVAAMQAGEAVDVFDAEHTPSLWAPDPVDEIPLEPAVAGEDEFIPFEEFG